MVVVVYLAYCGVRTLSYLRLAGVLDYQFLRLFSIFSYSPVLTMFLLLKLFSPSWLKMSIGLPGICLLEVTHLVVKRSVYNGVNKRNSEFKQYAQTFQMIK